MLPETARAAQTTGLGVRAYKVLIIHVSDIVQSLKGCSQYTRLSLGHFVLQTQGQ